MLACALSALELSKLSQNKHCHDCAQQPSNWRPHYICAKMKSRFSAADVSPDEQACVTWDRVCAIAKTKGGKENKQLLNGISGYVAPRNMVAIMGPSGCGKTTLLDILAGRAHSNVNVSGDILVNGRNVKMSYGTVAYVPQQDLLTGTLTVRETLLFTARLRLELSSNEREELVDSLMDEMGLLQARDTPVGTLFIKGISGGQKRRLSIAQEVLVSPSVMFLDEPTSGLDAAAAFFCVNSLRTLASQGRSIIMSIHQPSSEVFNLFNYLLLLSRGEMIYFGEASKAQEFYSLARLPCPEHRSLAEHFIHCMNTDFEKEAADFVPTGDTGNVTEVSVAPNEAAQTGRQEPEIVTAMVPMQSKSSRALPVVNAEKEITALRRTFEKNMRDPLQDEITGLVKKGGAEFRGIINTVNPFTQFVTLVQRMLLNAHRDVGVFWLRFFLYLGLALCLATIYYGLDKTWADTVSRSGCIFFAISFLTFMAISGFPSFIDEMQVFLRERLNGYYGVLTFTIANTIASIPYLAVIAVSCSLVLYYLVGLNSDGDRVIYFMLILFSALTAAEGLMMAISALVNHALLGIAMAACLMGIFMPVAGFIIPIDEIPRPVWYYPLHFMGFHTYAIHGTLVNEFDRTEQVWHCPCEISNNCDETDGPCRITGEEVLDALDFPTGRSKWIDLLVMFVITAVYRLMFFFTLKLKEAMAK